MVEKLCQLTQASEEAIALLVEVRRHAALELGLHLKGALDGEEEAVPASVIRLSKHQLPDFACSLQFQRIEHRRGRRRSTTTGKRNGRPYRNKLYLHHVRVTAD